MSARIDAFAGLHVLVIGEAMLDAYLIGTTSRVAREAPVPVVAIERREDAPGGAANTAANVASLGAQVSYLSVVGDDQEGRTLRDALAARGVPTDCVLTQVGRQTLAKHRVLAMGQVVARYDTGDTTAVNATTEAALCDALDALWPRIDAVIVSDYGYGVLTPRVIATLARLNAAAPRVVVADAKDLPRYRAVGPTAIKPNYAEAVQLIGAAAPPGASRAAHIAAHAGYFLDTTGAKIAAVTLDRDGALILTRDAPPHRTATRPAVQTHTTGAGDTFVAAFALALAADADANEAADLSALAASIAIARGGTGACTGAALRAALAPGASTPLADLLPIIAAQRAAGRRIVFTNGCFDLLHPGHVALLARAKARGDVLVVGLNTDASVRRLKGPERPLNTLDDRAAVLVALRSVDYVVPFAEDTPEMLIRALRPEMFVKGGDYTRATLPEASLVEALGGTVHIEPYLSDRSTTGIIARASGGGNRQRTAHWQG